MVNILRVRCPVNIALGIQRALIHLLVLFHAVLFISKKDCMLFVLPELRGYQLTLTSSVMCVYKRMQLTICTFTCWVLRDTTCKISSNVESVLCILFYGYLVTYVYVILVCIQLKFRNGGRHNSLGYLIPK